MAASVNDAAQDVALLVSAPQREITRPVFHITGWLSFANLDLQLLISTQSFPRNMAKWIGALEPWSLQSSYRPGRITHQPWSLKDALRQHIAHAKYQQPQLTLIRFGGV